MDSYQAQLTVGADPTPIETTVMLDGAQLEMAASGETLGKWQIADLALERIFGGYRMQVEGESATLKFSEPERFTEALNLATGVVPKPEAKAQKVKKEKVKKEKATKTKGRHNPAAVEAKQTAGVPAAVETTSAPEPAAERKSAVGWLDEKLESAQKKFGRYLPDWVFSRGGVVVAVGVLILILAKPGWFSVLFLVVAAIGLITSAIALLDQVIAVRIFRGGFTPVQGLIVSLSIGLVGMVLGALAR
jgi:hypothetical protein